MNENIKSQIEDLLSSNDVLLFMKGSALAPSCGFSASVVEILQNLGVKDLCDINVLSNRDLMVGIKIYNDWPTTPQLFVKGEFVGGADIVNQMYDDGSLALFLEEKGIIS